MNNSQIVQAVQWLLEKEQERLLREQRKKSISGSRMIEISDELHDIESMVEYTRKGLEEE